MSHYALYPFFLITLSATLCGEVLRLELPGTEHPVPIKIYLPGDPSTATPVVLFSHGLGGSREGAAYLGEHWSGAGYAVIALQHPGSDDSVWKDLPKWKAYRALKRAASGRSFMGRIHDVRVVLDWLEQSEETAAHPLYGRVDTGRIAMAGHSFGAVTTQAMMGQSFRNPGDRPFADARINCFILMSPSPGKQLNADGAFGSVTRPVLCMTGTADESPLRGDSVTPDSRLEVYAALPSGQAYQVVFHEGRHSIFSDFGDTDHRYHPAIEAITTDFLDAYLKHDAAALNRLRGGGARTSLEPQDLWEWK